MGCLKGLRRTTGLKSMGAIPQMNRSAKVKFQPIRCQESDRGIVLRNEDRTKDLGSPSKCLAKMPADLIDRD